MARWKKRDPSIYPARYTDLVLQAANSEGEWFTLSTHIGRYAAHMAADHFREWRMCLRWYGTGRAYHVETMMKIQLRLFPLEGNRWEVRLRVIPRRLNILLSHNPELRSW